jgi:hypothetical protein
MSAGMETQVLETPLANAERERPVSAPAPLFYLSTAEVAECTCPEPCERDHDRD